jgi:ribonuclease BN (tRNA processing enzyme)
MPTLTVLGCDGSWPSPGGAGSGYLVHAAGTNLLLDAGSGTFANLQQLGNAALIDAVVLTHEHPDHWMDLEAFAVWAGYGPGRSTFREPGTSPLPVYAPPGLREWSHFADASWLDWHELLPSMVIAIDPFVLRLVATDHSVPTVAVHVSHEGASLVYSSDSGPGWSVEEMGDDIGTFLCEASYTQASEGQLQHLSGRQAGTMARAAGVGRLILTHRWPTVSADDVRQEAELAFGRPVDQATVGAVFEW